MLISKALPSDIIVPECPLKFPICSKRYISPPFYNKVYSQGLNIRKRSGWLCKYLITLLSLFQLSMSGLYTCIVRSTIAILMSLLTRVLIKSSCKTHLWNICACSFGIGFLVLLGLTSSKWSKASITASFAICFTQLSMIFIVYLSMENFTFLTKRNPVACRDYHVSFFLKFWISL